MDLRTRKGKEHPNWRGGLSIPGDCLDCGKKLKHYKNKRCRTCSNKKQWNTPGYREKVSQKISETRIRLKLASGKRNPNWKGGFFPTHLTLRRCPQYLNWRNECFERDNFVCCLCKHRGGDLEVDHFPLTFREILRKNNITSYKKGIRCEELWDIRNGRTLCKKCHYKETNKNKK